MSDNTIFEQDGKIYLIMSHDMPAKELAKETAKAIREMRYTPRARMRVVSSEEARAMPWGSPEGCTCPACLKYEKSQAKKKGQGTLQPRIVDHRSAL